MLWRALAIALLLGACRGQGVDPVEGRGVREGNALLAVSDFQGAIEAYKRAIAQDPEDATAYGRLAYAQLFDPATQDAAIESARTATELAPESGRAYAYLARALDWNGDFDAALEAAERGVRLSPEDADVQSFYSEVLADLRHYDQAVRAGERAVELDPTNAEAHRNLGYVYSFVGRREEALAEYERAHALEPEFVHRLTSLAAHHLYRLGDERAAAEWLDPAEQLAPDDYITRLFRSRMLSDQGRPEEAIRYCELILEDAPLAADGHNCLAGVYFDDGRYSEAESARKAAIRVDPDNDQSYIGLGYVYYGLGECDQAQAEFERALAIHPRSGGNHSALGFALACQQRWDEAPEQVREPSLRDSPPVLVR